MLLQRPARFPAAAAVRRRLPRARVTIRAAAANWQALTAGQLTFQLNEEAFSKTEPHLRRIKQCLDKVSVLTRIFG